MTHKFRGKTVERKYHPSKWIFGSLISRGDAMSEYTAIEYKHEFEKSDNRYPGHCWSVEEVIPETVGALVLDYKGTQFYEGDMFDIITGSGLRINKIIRYIPERCAFCIANTEDIKVEHILDIWGKFDVEWLSHYKFEITGNVHDTK